jgi:hypothetical protein
LSTRSVLIPWLLAVTSSSAFNASGSSRHRVGSVRRSSPGPCRGSGHNDPGRRCHWLQTVFACAGREVVPLLRAAVVRQTRAIRAVWGIHRLPPPTMVDRAHALRTAATHQTPVESGVCWLIRLVSMRDRLRR